MIEQVSLYGTPTPPYRSIEGSLSSASAQAEALFLGTQERTPLEER